MMLSVRTKVSMRAQQTVLALTYSTLLPEEAVYDYYMAVYRYCSLLQAVYCYCIANCVSLLYCVTSLLRYRLCYAVAGCVTLLQAVLCHAVAGCVTILQAVSLLQAVIRVYRPCIATALQAVYLYYITGCV